MGLVVICLYTPEHPERWPYNLLPDNLVHTLQIERASEKQLNIKRVKDLLQMAFPQEYRSPHSFFVERHERGWLTHVNFNKERYLALILNESDLSQ